MSSIFAAVDIDGNTRFVGDVPSGRACACFCPSCSSPLEAKKGEVNTWHFAHVANQERPECHVGALNLLRRLVIKTLVSNPVRQYRHQATITDSLPFDTGRQKYSRTIESSLTLAQGTSITWVDYSDARKLPPRNQPVGSAPLSNGGTLQIFVDVHNEIPGTNLMLEAPDQEDSFQLVVWCPEPVKGALTSEVSAETFLQRNLRTVWIRFPDLDGRRAAALEEVNGLAAAETARLEEEKARRSVVQRSLFGTTSDEDAFAQLRGLASAPAGRSTEKYKGTKEWSWAPDLKPHASIFLYTLRNGDAWAAYETTAGNFRVLPWPNRWDGWDEFFPPSVATMESDHRSLMSPSLRVVGAYLVSMGAGTRNDSDPSRLPDYPPDL